MIKYTETDRRLGHDFFMILFTKHAKKGVLAKK